jgi:hypothetical protein
MNAAKKKAKSTLLISTIGAAVSNDQLKIARSKNKRAK